MKMGKGIVAVGTAMFAIGLIMFYSIELGQTDPVLRIFKNAGTFIGLSGMGAILAGMLIHFISRGGPPIKENTGG